MNIIVTISKRRRIHKLVRKSIAETAVDANPRAQPGLLIADAVKSFVDAWPAKYFDIADDRKIGGLVLAYMLEISALAGEDINEHGYQLLKVAAEVDPDEFRENSPRTCQQLRRRDLLENGIWKL